MAERAALDQLRAAVVALGDTADALVFVGGAVVRLLITDPNAPPARSTMDVDAILGGATRARYYELERQLRRLGFRQDTSGDSPLCRWFKDDLIVDVCRTTRASWGSAIAGTRTRSRRPASSPSIA